MSAKRSPALVEPEPEPAPGDLIAGKYRVERVIGRGGMGIVVAAMHERLREIVAIKLIRSGSGMEAEDAIARFMREARAVVKIKSPYVAKLLDVDALADGMPYMVMEYLEGRDLAKELSARGSLPIEEAVDYVIQVCLGLSAAHELGVVHRDLKLSNLFLTTGAKGSRHIKVLDFGISKILDGSSVDGAGALTAPHSVMGSPSYMSPEQIRDSKDVDQRADIWSVGVILYELLTGKRPFSGRTSTAILASICSDRPAPLLSARPEAPAELARIIEHCLEKPRERRPQSVSAVQDALLPFASARIQSICAHGADLPLSRPSEPARSERRGTDHGPPSPSEQAPTRNERGPMSSSASAPLSWIDSAPKPANSGSTLRNGPQLGLPDENKANASPGGFLEGPRAAPQQRQYAALMFMAGVIATLTVSVALLVTKIEKPPLQLAQGRMFSELEINQRGVDTPYSINPPVSDGGAPVSVATGAPGGSAPLGAIATAPVLSSSVPAGSPPPSETTKPAALAPGASKTRGEGPGEARSPKGAPVSRPNDDTDPKSSDDEDSRH